MIESHMAPRWVLSDGKRDAATRCSSPDRESDTMENTYWRNTLVGSSLNSKKLSIMPVKSPQFEINIRKNDNALSEAYGKYYPKAVEKQTISLRGLCNHMAEHNSIYGRDIIQGVLMKMSGCIVELLSQGNPVKIDGLGTFVPTVESEMSGISKADLIAGKWNPQTYV